MSVIQNFVSLNGAVDAVYDPKTARALVNIIEDLQQRADLDRFSAILQKFLDHTHNHDNPHGVTQLDNVRADALDAIYELFQETSKNEAYPEIPNVAARIEHYVDSVWESFATNDSGEKPLAVSEFTYIKERVASLVRSQFDATVVANPHLFLELLRRLIDNRQQWIDGLRGPTTDAFGVDAMTVPPVLPRPIYQLSPTTVFGQNFTAGVEVGPSALPFPTGTLVLRATLQRVSPTLPAPLLVLRNARESLLLSKPPGHARRIEAALFNDVEAFSDPTVLMAAYLQQSHQNLNDAYANMALELQLQLEDPATPPVAKRIGAYLDTVFGNQAVVPSLAVDGLMLNQFVYDPHRKRYTDGVVANPLVEDDREYEQWSPPTSGNVPSDAYIAISYAQDQMVLYYGYLDGRMRSAITYTYGFAAPLTTVEVPIALTHRAMNGNDALHALHVYPGVLTPAQVMDAFTALAGV